MSIAWNWFEEKPSSSHSSLRRVADLITFPEFEEKDQSKYGPLSSIGKIIQDNKKVIFGRKGVPSRWTPRPAGSLTRNKRSKTLKRENWWFYNSEKTVSLKTTRRVATENMGLSKQSSVRKKRWLKTALHGREMCSTAIVVCRWSAHHHTFACGL